MTDTSAAPGGPLNQRVANGLQYLILLAVVAAAGALWDMSGRVTVLEAQGEAMAMQIARIDLSDRYTATQARQDFAAVHERAIRNADRHTDLAARVVQLEAALAHLERQADGPR